VYSYCNICNIWIYFCNIRMKPLQHSAGTRDVDKTWWCARGLGVAPALATACAQAEQLHDGDQRNSSLAVDERPPVLTVLGGAYRTSRGRLGRSSSPQLHLAARPLQSPSLWRSISTVEKLLLAAGVGERLTPGWRISLARKVSPYGTSSHCFVHTALSLSRERNV
jgi:hypothetical protein